MKTGTGEMVEMGRIKIRIKHHEIVGHFKMYTVLYAGDTATGYPVRF
jgi:hypothetical protein